MARAKRATFLPLPSGYCHRCGQWRKGLLSGLCEPCTRALEAGRLPERPEQPTQLGLFSASYQPFGAPK